MRIFFSPQSIMSRTVMLGLVLASGFGMPSANGHEYNALIKAKKFAEVERAISARLAVDANNADALIAKTDLILAEAKSGRLEEAEKVLREAILRAPDSAAAYLGLGKALQEQGKHKDALPHLEKSLSIDASAAVFYRLGKAWQASGDKAKSIFFFERALAFTPELGKKTRADAQEQLMALK
ncbi:MAG: hypothetical protein RL748_1325 [Pseudomonadota bacterium]|jgi:tetratricopeptide (TPR) repeat protein